MSVASKALPASAPPLLADHPVLDMLNTVVQVDGASHEHWQSDADVLQWLQRTGMLDGELRTRLAGGGLLAAARELREIVRPLLQRRKAGRHGDPRALNEFLRRAPGYPVLDWPRDAAPRVVRGQAQLSAEQWLAPLAEAAAELLVHGQFELVRRCEHPDCTLWFYDRTKSHKRRWCSMAVCGNRHKVAQFRRRREA